MSKKEDIELAKLYAESIEKVKKGESNSFEVNNANELFKMIKE